MNSRTNRLCISLMLGIGLTLALLSLSGAPFRGSASAWAASGNVYCVTPSGSAYPGCDQVFTDVQAALDAASGGEVIRIATGTYSDVYARPRQDVSTTGVVTQVAYISKTVILLGGYSSDLSIRDPDTYPTILDAQRQGRVLYITGDISPTIDGLTITGGSGTGLGGGAVLGSDAGGGMYVLDATVTLRNSKIVNNAASAPLAGVGGGVYVAYGQATMLSNRVISNTADTGGGVALVAGSATLSGNTIMSNKAHIGGGVGTSSRITMANNTILGNTALAGGGMYVLYSSQADLHSNIFQANQALGDQPEDGGGGIWIGLSGPVTLTNTIVNHNQATHRSPGILIQHSDARLLHATIAGNTGGTGSGIELYGSAAALTNTIVVSHATGITVSASSVATLNGILWFGNGSDTEGPGSITVTDQHTGDPAFAADSYHITAGSAAIGKGVSAGVTTDVDGDHRIVPPDLGADEYVLKTYLPICFNNAGS